HAVDTPDLMAAFSSQGPVVWSSPAQILLKPDFVAPGVGICSTRAAAFTYGTCFDDEHAAISGTSMAAPHVAGAAALLHQAHPDWSPAQVKKALASTAVQLINPATGVAWGVDTQGYGRIDVAAALNANPTSGDVSQVYIEPLGALTN